MDAPPSFTSLTARPTDHDQYPQATEPNHFEQQQEEHYNPSMSKIRSYSSFEDRTVDRAIVQVQPTETYDVDDGGQAISIGAMAACRAEGKILDEVVTDTSYSNNEQPPSMGFMVGDRVDSQPGGGGFSYNAPPSHGDLGRHGDSSTIESSDGGRNDVEEDYEGMSLTGRDFARLYPTNFS
ncbi:hypothetical protein M8C21_018752 [Ambrosia artemisiifolia]|uniref:Uncharacterized protein n=1 Tax=Ambrosia artemisiifolia TaxID=4212 RepID=A0AAD5GWM9_AMBAR|nr:hypothetical protein M8C21_018752 [Ambrosia artemisiifolia]